DLLPGGLVDALPVVGAILLQRLVHGTRLVVGVARRAGDGGSILSGVAEDLLDQGQRAARHGALVGIGAEGDADVRTGAGGGGIGARGAGAVGARRAGVLGARGAVGAGARGAVGAGARRAIGGGDLRRITRSGATRLRDLDVQGALFDDDLGDARVALQLLLYGVRIAERADG